MTRINQDNDTQHFHERQKATRHNEGHVYRYTASICRGVSHELIQLSVSATLPR